MADTTIARRYARALLELGMEQDKLERVSEELRRFTEMLHANDDQILKILVHPGLLPDERARFLGTLLERYPFDETVASFARLALEKGRAALIPQINDELQVMADEKFGRVRAVLSTAAAISDELVAEFQAALESSTGKTILLETRVDAALIGGVTVAVGDTIYDASVRSRLSAIRKTLLDAKAPAEA